MKTTRILFLLLVLGLLPISEATACKCDEPGSMQGAYECAHFVVVGKVLHKSRVSFAETIQPTELALLEQTLDSSQKRMLYDSLVVKVELAVTHLFKGKVATKTVIIYTPLYSGACGYTGFKEGQSFVVYGSRSSFLVRYHFSKKEGIQKAGTFWTQDCNRTGIASPEEIAQLKKVNQ